MVSQPRNFNGRPARAVPGQPRWWRTPVLLVCLLCVTGIRAEGNADVRVLIDVSGSMRETDPHNLRVPAARLLINLLPDGASAGFWTFGTEGAVLVPRGEVGDAWRARAMQRVDRIDSSARYTDIADGMYLVDRNWPDLGDEAARIVILLTDGQVDVDDDPRLDAQSRAELLRDRLPAMQQRGVRLYAVGLSAGADLQLLEEMAILTGGFAVVARDADELLGAFLDIFAAAVPVNAVPVERQRFQVDPSIADLTVVAMHPHRQEPVSLRLPDGSTWTGSAHGSTARWLAQDTFTLIHAKEPPPGEWVLLGGGRDTRVHIHSDLELSLEGIHQHALAGEMLAVSAGLRNATGAQVDADLRDLLHYRLRLVAPMGVATDLDVQLQPDGRVTARLPVPNAPGLYRVEAVAVAGIIHRHAAALLRVYENAYQVSEEDIENASGAGKRFTLRIRPDVIEQSGLRVSGILRTADGRTRAVPVSLANNGWVAELNLQSGLQEFRYRLDGRLRNERRFETLTPARVFAQPEPAPPESPQAPSAEESPSPGEESAAPRWVWMAGIALVSIAVGGLVLLFWLRWRKNRQSADETTDSDDSGEEEDVPAIVSLTQTPGQKRRDPEASDPP